MKHARGESERLMPHTSTNYPALGVQPFFNQNFSFEHARKYTRVDTNILPLVQIFHTAPSQVEAATGKAPRIASIDHQQGCRSRLRSGAGGKILLRLAQGLRSTMSEQCPCFDASLQVNSQIVRTLGPVKNASGGVAGQVRTGWESC